MAPSAMRMHLSIYTLKAGEPQIDEGKMLVGICQLMQQHIETNKKIGYAWLHPNTPYLRSIAIYPSNCAIIYLIDFVC